MDILFIITISLLFISIIVHCIMYHIKKETDKYISSIHEQWVKEAYLSKQRSISEIQNRAQETQNQLDNLLHKKEQIEKEIQTKKEFNDNLRQIREDELNRLIEAEKAEKIEAVSKEVADWMVSAQEAATFAHEELEAQLFDQTCQKQKELEDLEQEIIDFKARQASINQEILRRRAIEENEDFYRVQLPEVVAHDIHILNSIRPQLSKIDNFDKFIYDIYVKKSVDEMIKRVLEGGAPCGIYRITRLKTGETYIGKSTDIKSRWQQHAKSAFHCGTISHSILHTTMEKDGIENFQWEVIEEVPKSELGAREKFWIDVYGSKDYGLNEKAGG